MASECGSLPTGSSSSFWISSSRARVRTRKMLTLLVSRLTAMSLSPRRVSAMFVEREGCDFLPLPLFPLADTGEVEARTRARQAARGAASQAEVEGGERRGRVTMAMTPSENWLRELGTSLPGAAPGRARNEGSGGHGGCA